MPSIDLTKDELDLLCEALDSHRYWQLSDPKYRNDGDILEPYSDEPEKAEEVKKCDELEEKLRGVR